MEMFLGFNFALRRRWSLWLSVIFSLAAHIKVYLIIFY